MDSQIQINASPSLEATLRENGTVSFSHSNTAVEYEQAENSDSSDQEDFEEGDTKSIGKLSTSSKKIRKEAACKREKYNVIANDVRLELIDCVINKGEKIKRAAARLGINYSSAKSIFQVYKKEGRSDKKSSKRNKVKKGSGEKVSPKSDFVNIPPTNASESSPGEEAKSFQNLDFLNNPFIEKLKAYETLLQPYPNPLNLDLVTLNIQKSESVPNYNPCGLEFSRNRSVDPTETPIKTGGGFSLFNPSSSGIGAKSSFLSANSAFTKVPRKISSTSLVIEKQTSSGQENILQPNQSFQLFKSDEKVQEKPNPLKNWTNEDKQDLMRALRYLTPEPNMLNLSKIQASSDLENRSISLESQE